MRQLHLQVRRALAERVVQLARQHEAFSPAFTPVERADGEDWVMIFLNLPNSRVGDFILEVEREVEDGQFVLFPEGVLPIQTPLSRIHEQVRRVSPRSTLELVLGALQSVGSWKGMLLYAAFSGIIAAYGVIFNTAILLVAAMLIAPMGAPVMVCVIGVAVGDWKMVVRGARRFFTAIAVLIISAVALGAAYGLSFSTSAMEEAASLSAWVVLLGVVGGAAGAQAQIQSSRDSLVSGTATGFLIAVSLSPVSAVLGLALILGRWNYVAQMAFVLVLTFFGIIAGGWLLLSFYGVRPADASARRGSGAVRTGLAAAVLLAVIGLVVWQSRQEPHFRKADLSREAIELVRSASEAVPGARLLEATAHFTRPDLETGTGEGLLIQIMVEHTRPSIPAQEIERMLRDAVEERIRANMTRVIPFVDITVLPGRSNR